MLAIDQQRIGAVWARERVVLNLDSADLLRRVGHAFGPLHNQPVQVVPIDSDQFLSLLFGKGPSSASQAYDILGKRLTNEKISLML
jgi:hypothetical protein